MSKIALVTGASSGIGKETARLLVESGYIVYGAARKTEKMEDIKTLGVNIISLDVTDESSIENCVKQIIEKKGRIDILINNAGFGLYGTIEDVPINEGRRQMEVNLFGMARLIQLVLPYMRHNRYGKIVNISSIAGKLATPLGGWYHASKFAVEGLSDSLRLEVKPFGIDVIIIEPGGIKTEWADIANENLNNIAANPAYKSLTDKAGNFFGMIKNGTPPIVIARLIKKAIEAKRPKARYAKGKMAGIALFGRRWLGDRLFDYILMKLLKFK